MCVPYVRRSVDMSNRLEWTHTLFFFLSSLFFSFHWYIYKKNLRIGGEVLRQKNKHFEIYFAYRKEKKMLLSQRKMIFHSLNILQVDVQNYFYFCFFFIIRHRID